MRLEGEWGGGSGRSCLRGRFRAAFERMVDPGRIGVW